MNRNPVIRAAVAAVAAVILAIPVAAAPALGAEDNTAIAINTKDGSSLFRFAFSVHRTVNEVIEETNIAISYASCEGCQTVAVAIQIVIVSSDPDAIVPENVALAINQECTSCDTMASAYQFVVGGGGMTLDKEGRKRIKEIRKAFYDIAKEAEKEGLTNAGVEQRLLPLVEEIKVVLSEHVVSEDVAGDQGAEDAGDGGATPQPTGSGSAEPSASPSAQPSASPSEDASPAAEPGAEPAPTSSP